MADKSITPKNLADWRNWLEKNHLKEDKVIFIKYKRHTGKPIISNADAMKEAICFGFIDTTAKKVDDERWSITYVRRGKNSRWSVNTLKYGKELLKQGKMSEFGIKMYKEGLRKKAFDGHIPINPDMPEELKRELAKDETIKQIFDTIPPSRKKMYYRRILYAKRPETRQKRIMEIIKICKELIIKKN
jgi:uncharacterized protein YdeI (YjbR/CyaY-like superfamily)